MTEYDDSMLLKFDKIGKATLFDVLVEDEYPVVFVCKDMFDTMYLFYEVDYTENDTDWLAMKITRNQYLKLLLNNKSLEETYRESITNEWFMIRENADNDETKTEIIKEFPEYAFPYKDPVFVGKESKESQISQDLLEEARQTQSSFMDIRLKDVWSTIYSQSVSIKSSILVKIANQVEPLLKLFLLDKESVNLQLVKGSTIVRFTFEQTNLLVHDDAINALSSIKEALSSNESSDIHSAFNGDIDKIEKYKGFIETLGKIDKGVEISAVTPNYNTVFFKEINEDFALLHSKMIDGIYAEKTENVIMVGELYSINTRTKKVQFVDNQTNNVIKGDLKFDLKGQEFKVPNNYEFEVLMFRKVDINGKVLKESYTITRIKNLL